MIGLYIRIVFVYIFSVLLINSYGQKSSNKKFYLLEDLNYEQLSSYDKNLLDSILPLYHAATLDTLKIAYLDIIIEASNDDYLWPKYNQFVLDYCQKCLQKTDKYSEEEILFFKKEIAGTYNNLGFLKSNEGNLNMAITYYLKSLKLNEEINNRSGFSSTYNNIGAIYLHQGNIPKALEYFEKSLKISEELGNKENIANSLSNLGYIYKTEGDLKSAFKFYSESMNMQKEVNDQEGLSVTLSNMGAMYMESDSILKARNYFRKSIAIKKERGNLRGLVYSYSNLGITYAKTGQYDSSIYYQNLSLDIGKKLEDKLCISIAYDNLASSYLEINQLNKAKEYALEALRLAEILGYPDKIKGAAHTLISLYKKEKDWANAFKMQELFYQMKDSVVNESNRKASYKQKLKHEFEKKEQIMQVEEEKRKAIFKEKEKLDLTIIWSISIVLLFTLIFTIFILRRYNITNRQKVIIDDQNQKLEAVNQSLHKKNIQITDSILYAKKLQKSILTTETDIKKLFTHSFVFFEPKDIVSGDFFWINETDQHIYLAVVDCTGHGVPGAMLSVVSHTLLDKAVSMGFIDPADLLEFTHTELIKILSQESNYTNTNDGFDISLCIFDKKSDEFKFCGAHNFGLIIRGKLPKILEADNISVGSMNKKKNFITRSYKIQKDDILFLFSDGFRDQFGEKTNKKLYYQNFEKLLFDIASLDSHKQNEELETFFNNWKGDREQIDDVTVLGIKF